MTPLPTLKDATLTVEGRIAVRYTKRLMKLAQRQNLEEHLEACSAVQAICHKTEDHAEALAAFFEKRAGQFKGR